MALTEARRLLNTRSVREAAEAMLDRGRRGALRHFALHEDRLADCVGYVIETMAINYPHGDIPFHARWRHFRAGGRDLFMELDRSVRWVDGGLRLAAHYDLAIVSVLLDAGAGPDWTYREPQTGLAIGRSEGLGLASLDMVRQGFFSAVPDDPFRVDARALLGVTERLLEAGFQVSEANPMVGLAGRAALLRRLGEVLAGSSGGEPPVDDFHRPSRILAGLDGIRPGGRIGAGTLLEEVLIQFGPVWPERADAVRGAGDAWRYEAADGSTHVVAFHKLSQWLTYSLIEPLQWAGIEVVEIDDLTGLPEYRNGGLFLDSGVLSLKDPADAARVHGVGSALIVEWRALTVALLDRVAEGVRRHLRIPAPEMPLARVLEGGTWSAGRRIAREKRAGGGPPLMVESDGTVF